MSLETGQKRGKGGTEAARHRRCIVTRHQADDHDLIRFVLDPHGIVVPDVKATLPGRGAWVSANRAVLVKAIQRNAFTRALKPEQPIGGLDDLEQRTEKVLRQQAMGALGFARKAGLVQTGFTKVESAIKSNKAHALLHATDAGADGQSKLDRLAGHAGVPIFRVFTHDEIGLSLGLEHVIHAALLAGPGAEKFIAPISRLGAFRFVDDGPKNMGLAQANKRSIAGANKRVRAGE
ncbi:MAG: RNA-binding protein [Pseudomonadota bacterium]